MLKRLKTYKRYHTNVKLIFALGIENQLLPKDFIESIPKTSSHEWKKKKELLFYSSKYEDVLNGALRDLKVLSDERVRNHKKMFISFCRLYLMVLSVIGE